VDYRADIGELNRLVADLDQAAAVAPTLARVVVQKSSADVKRDAQAFAPVDTGNLRSSITYNTRELRDTVVGEIGPTAAYGGYVEFGTSRQAPAAYMGPALDRNGPAFVAAMEQLGVEALRRAGIT
jgi:HK97 gp10 family phage protein